MPDLLLEFKVLSTLSLGQGRDPAYLGAGLLGCPHAMHLVMQLCVYSSQWLACYTGRLTARHSSRSPLQQVSFITKRTSFHSRCMMGVMPACGVSAGA